MSASHFETLVNGPRAIAATMVLYSRDEGISKIVIVDHRAGRRGSITSDFADPVWIGTSAG